MGQVRRSHGTGSHAALMLPFTAHEQHPPLASSLPKTESRCKPSFSPSLPFMAPGAREGPLTLPCPQALGCEQLKGMEWGELVSLCWSQPVSSLSSPKSLPGILLGCYSQ